jgi:hypothetical protein
MKEKITNTLIDEENNPFTIKCKIDVLEMLKNMKSKDQEQLIDWFIEKINERIKINSSDVTIQYADGTKEQVPNTYSYTFETKKD